MAKLWDIYGIPSLVVLDKDRELGRFVNRDRKTKAHDFRIFSRIEVGERERMIVTYNKEQVGECLDAHLEKQWGCQVSSRAQRQSSRVYREDKQETVAWNIFEASTFFALDGKGQLFLSDEQVARLNQELQAEGFAEVLVNDKEPKFVVGQIVEMVAHPDSDHLNICQVAIGPDKTVQIVAGAPKCA